MSGASVARGRTTAHRSPPGRQHLHALKALYSRYGALVGYAIAALAVYVGWLGRDERNIDAGHGLGYALGACQKFCVRGRLGHLIKPLRAVPETGWRTGPEPLSIAA